MTTTLVSPTKIELGTSRQSVKPQRAAAAEPEVVKHPELREKRAGRLGRCLWLALACLLLPPQVLRSPAEVSERAARIHQQALVFDAHLHAINRHFYFGGHIGESLSDGHFDLPRAKKGGLDAMFLSLYIAEEYYPARFETKQSLRLIDFCLDQIAKNRDLIEVALNASDIERIQRKGKIAAVLDIEGGFDLDGDLAVLRDLHRLGVRVIQLPAHNWANQFADSCCAPGKWHGLNDHGRAVIREMNRLGIVINVSHASDETLEQAVEASSVPVIATHHGLRSFNDIPRNMPERLLKKLAAKGGVIGFQIGSDFHSRKFFDWKTKTTGKVFWDRSGIGHKESLLSIAEIDKRVAAQYPGDYFGMSAPDDLKLSVDGWVEVVDRAIQLVGEDSVALGTDLDGGPTLPRGMRDVSDLAMITDAMLRRGYTEQRIQKFLGGNLLRVFRQITEKR
ncbi:MAG: membrane dipeptidase [Acidimicrobiia bacterium]|nr:membrane dipeptidase [Acidimicrobiia bacterium]